VGILSVRCSPFLLCIGLILTVSPGSDTVSADTVRADRCQRTTSVDLKQADAEFKKLRTIAGHFGGGSWNDGVDKWMGRKHRLMLELESLIVAGSYTKSCVIQLLGPPDQEVSQGHRLYPAIISAHAENDTPMVATDKYIVYYWRGEHDFLFFACRQGKVVHSGWWYAGE
jgi:hypothetical protein